MGRVQLWTSILKYISLLFVSVVGLAFVEPANFATWNLSGRSVALVVVISGFGALNGWTMLSAEMPKAAAQDGLFPARFDRLSRRGVPIFGILVSGVLASVLVLVSYIGEAGITVFNTLILMNGIAAAIPYAFSGLAQIKWRIADRRAISTSRFVRDVSVAVLSVIFFSVVRCLLKRH
jgi:APA family basic amino acid/polyamine antiporter